MSDTGGVSGTTAVASVAHPPSVASTRIHKPPRVAQTYEAYYAKLTQDSELNKFKVTLVSHCLVASCSGLVRVYFICMLKV